LLTRTAENSPIEPSASTGKKTRTVQHPSVGRFGSVNWLGLWTLYKKEVQRFLKVIFQTVLAPVILTMLYLVVFSIAFDRGRAPVENISYITFLVPGLVIMAVMNNAFANSSSSLIIGKVQGSIVDILMAPLSAAELAAGFIAGAVSRGALVGLITLGTCAVFLAISDRFVFHAPFVALYFGLSAASLFAAVGVISGMWASKFDQLAAITNFVVQPLTFLSGTFYPISRLPEPFLGLSQANPVFMLVDGFRYGVIGHAEGDLTLSAILILVLNLGLGFTCYALLKAGYKIKS